MPTFAKNHEECRKSVCVICMKKGDQELTENFKAKILQQIQKEINFNDDRVPLATCISCRSHIGKLCDGKTNVVPQIYDFESISIKPLTRFSTVCECLICKIAKLKGKERHPLSKCLSVIGRGLPHYCTPGTRHENLRRMAASDPIGAEQVAATVLGSKSASPHGTIRLSQPCGKLLPLRKGPSSAQQLFKEPLTTQNMVQIQQNIGLSNNGMRKLGSALNQISPIRLVEPSFQQKFAQASQKLCDHFTVSSITLAENNQISQVVHCQNLSSLSDVFLASRKMTDSAILKLGIDGGGSFLKVSFTHIIVDEGETPPHSPLQKTIKLMSPQLNQQVSSSNYW
nr:uncharacterized protein LOC124819137 [Hydra vulgaris]